MRRKTFKCSRCSLSLALPYLSDSSPCANEFVKIVENRKLGCITNMNIFRQTDHLRTVEFRIDLQYIQTCIYTVPHLYSIQSNCSLPETASSARHSFPTLLMCPAILPTETKFCLMSDSFAKTCLLSSLANISTLCIMTFHS